MGDSTMAITRAYPKVRPCVLCCQAVALLFVASQLSGCEGSNNSSSSNSSNTTPTPTPTPTPTTPPTPAPTVTTIKQSIGVPVTAAQYLTNTAVKASYEFAYADVIGQTSNGAIKASTAIASAPTTRRSITVAFTATITNDAQAATTAQSLATNNVTGPTFAAAVNRAISTLNYTANVTTINASDIGTISAAAVTTVTPPPPTPPTPTPPTPPTSPAVQAYQQISQSIILGAAVASYTGTTQQAFECGYIGTLNAAYTCASGVSAVAGVSVTSTYTARRSPVVAFITTLNGQVRITVGATSVSALKAKIEAAAAALGLAGFTVTITTINGATFTYSSSATHGVTVGLTALVVAAIAYLH